MPADTKIRHNARVTRATLSTWQPAALRRVITERGWTLSRTAAEVDVAEGRIQRWTYGAVPDPDIFVRLANVLGVATTDLAPLSDAPTLLERRWHAGHTVTTLAEQIGRSSAYTARITRGGQPIAPAALPQWATALNISEAEVQRAWENTRAQLRED